MKFNKKKMMFLGSFVFSSAALFALFQNFSVVTDVQLADKAYVGNTVSVPFQCAIENNDKGCQQRVMCPTGYRPRVAKAICNLEYSTLDIAALANVRDGYIQVVKRSGGEAGNGSCAINGTAVSQGKVLIEELATQYPYINISCSEKDVRSGGDCNITGTLQCEKYDGALYSHKLKLEKDRVVQGMWKFDDGTWLVTQDDDGRARQEKVRFNLVNAQGTVLKTWVLKYGTHGQSLFVRKSSTGFDVFTETVNGNGIAQFFLNSNKSDIKFVKEIIPVQDPKNIVTIASFGVDAASDRLVAFYKNDLGKNMWVMSFSQLLNGVIQLQNQFKPKGAFGAIQGVGILNNSIYLLSGDGVIENDKSVFKFSLDGKAEIVRYEIRVSRGVARAEGSKNEPEGLHISANSIYFAMATEATTRVYSLSPDFSSN